MTIKDILDKHDIKHGIENDQARIDEFVSELRAEIMAEKYFDPITVSWLISDTDINRVFGTE